MEKRRRKRTQPLNPFLTQRLKTHLIRRITHIIPFARHTSHERRLERGPFLQDLFDFFLARLGGVGVFVVYEI